MRELHAPGTGRFRCAVGGRGFGMAYGVSSTTLLLFVGRGACAGFRGGAHSGGRDHGGVGHLAREFRQRGLVQDRLAGGPWRDRCFRRGDGAGLRVHAGGDGWPASSRSSRSSCSASAFTCSAASRSGGRSVRSRSGPFAGSSSPLSASSPGSSTRWAAAGGVQSPRRRCSLPGGWSRARSSVRSTPASSWSRFALASASSSA